MIKKHERYLLEINNKLGIKVLGPFSVIDRYSKAIEIRKKNKNIKVTRLDIINGEPIIIDFENIQY